jgi:hypothetical protein
MNKTLTALAAAVSIAGATLVTAGPANAQWGGDWRVGGDYYQPAYGYGYGAATVPAAPYAIVVVPTVPAVVVPAVPAVPTYGYGGYSGYAGYGGYGGYASTGYWPYQNLYSYAPGYYRRWYWQ